MTSEKTLNWMEQLARSLIQHAARRAPAELPERLAEEWLADMSERRAGWSRVRFALGCCWATSIISRERAVVIVHRASPAVAPAALGGFLQMTPSFSSRRTFTFVVVASLHAVALGGLMLGLTATYTKAPPPDFQTKVIDEPRPPVEGPNIDLPTITNTAIDLPPLDNFPPIASDATLTTTEPQISSEPTPSEPPTPPTHVINRIQGGPGVGFPSTNDFYPPKAIRAEEQGLATVNACVDPKGRLTADPSILESTGSAALDQAALRLAKAASGHYQASSEDGRAVNSCFGFRIRFTLRR